MQVFNFLMIKVDGPIILGNLKVEFLIEILMQFFLKSLNPNFHVISVSYSLIPPVSKLFRL